VNADRSLKHLASFANAGPTTMIDHSREYCFSAMVSVQEGRAACRPRNPTACSMPVRLWRGLAGESERDVERGGFDVERGGSKCEKRFGPPAL
jgi:hypothetical protein